MVKRLIGGTMTKEQRKDFEKRVASLHAEAERSVRLQGALSDSISSKVKHLHKIPTSPERK